MLVCARRGISQDTGLLALKLDSPGQTRASWSPYCHRRATSVTPQTLEDAQIRDHTRTHESNTESLNTHTHTHTQRLTHTHAYISSWSQLVLCFPLFSSAANSYKSPCHYEWWFSLQLFVLSCLLSVAHGHGISLSEIWRVILSISYVDVFIKYNHQLIKRFFFPRSWWPFPFFDINTSRNDLWPRQALRVVCEVVLKILSSGFPVHPESKPLEQGCRTLALAEASPGSVWLQPSQQEHFPWRLPVISVQS